MSKLQTYKMLSGDELEFPLPEPKTFAFLARVLAATEDPRVDDVELTNLIYGAENPLLRQDILPGQGVVTQEVFAQPAYQVMVDLLGRKRAHVGIRAAAGAEFSMTIAAAAKKHGVHVSAIRQAVAAGRIGAQKLGGTYFLRPADVEAFKPARRGPAPQHQLEVRHGNAPGASFRVKVDGGQLVRTGGNGHVEEARVDRFDRIGVLSGGKGEYRFFVLKPADKPGELLFEDFFVRGQFEVASKVNNSQRAREAWKAFAGAAGAET